MRRRARPMPLPLFGCGTQPEFATISRTFMISYGTRLQLYDSGQPIGTRSTCVISQQTADDLVHATHDIVRRYSCVSRNKERNIYRAHARADAATAPCRPPRVPRRETRPLPWWGGEPA